jgi:hypothetical protein
MVVKMIDDMLDAFRVSAGISHFGNSLAQAL